MQHLVYSHAENDPTLSSLLTTYQGKPAIFYQQSPSDVDDGFSRPCFPRMNFNIDKTADPERKIAGVLTFSIFATNESVSNTGGDPDTEIDQRLRELFDGAFFSEDGKTTCTVWASSDAFSAEPKVKTTEASPTEVIGVISTYYLTEFPSQITTEPDPVVGCNRWLKQHFPETKSIEFDTLPTVWKGSDVEPAVYWRFEGEDSLRENYSVSWYLARLCVHVITDTIQERNRWTKAIVEALKRDGEVLLEDESPMFVKQISIKHDGDALRTGQIFITGEYGVLETKRKERAAPRLMKPYFRKGKKEHGKRKHRSTSDRANRSKD